MHELKLSEFLSFLMGLTSQDFLTDKVDRFLGESWVRPEDLYPFIHFRKDTYGRNLVARTDRFEMIVLTWLPGQRTPIHDHAGQRCWMFLQSGKLCFKNYEIPASEDSPLVSLGCAETLEARKTVYIDDSIAVHSIANNGSEAAVSLHLYAGPIPRCRIYNEGTKQFQWVELSYFTTPGRIPYASRPVETSTL